MSGERLATVLESSRLVVCCGSGGVGKTTTSAALALKAAEQGRHAVVLTVDPARRLATCLGLDEIGWRPHRVPRDDLAGSLWAMMLDTRAMFDDLVRRLAPDEETAETIQQSRLYGVFAGTMHGTPEYMALESLYNVYVDDRFDLVVLDTPPLTNALEFFTVPERASWMFDDRIMRWFVAEKRRGLFKRFHPGSVVLKLISTLAGDGLVSNLVEFFTALDAIREALQRRGVEVARILREPSTAYLVVTGPHVRRIDEALELDRQLEALEQSADAFVVNRSHAAFDPDLQPASSDTELLSALGNLEGGLGNELDSISAIGSVRELYALMAASGHRHREQIQRLTDTVGPDRIRTVPDFEEDIHDLETLSKLGMRVAGT